MNRDPEVALIALALLLVVGAIAAVVGALRADRSGTRQRGGGFDAAQVREGEWTLTLDSPGPKKIRVIKELRAITGLGLADAKALADHAPSPVLSRVDHSSASDAYRLLTAAGGSARIIEDRVSSAPAEPESDRERRFTVVLDDAGDRKIQVIKEIRGLTNLSLVEAKRLVENAPSEVLTQVHHRAATAVQAKFAKAGAVARIVES